MGIYFCCLVQKYLLIHLDIVRLTAKFTENAENVEKWGVYSNPTYFLCELSVLCGKFEM